MDIETHWLEAIIACRNRCSTTRHGTYVWIVTNRKEKRRKGKIQLLDAREFWTAAQCREQHAAWATSAPYRRGQIDEIVRLYGWFEDDEHSKFLTTQISVYHSRHGRTSPAAALSDDH